MKTGIIGCGNIGTELALFIDKDRDFELNYLCDINIDLAHELQKKIGNGQKVTSIGDLIANSELIIEAASKDAVKDIINSKNIDKKGKKLIIMSTGGLIENLDS